MCNAMWCVCNHVLYTHVKGLPLIPSSTGWGGWLVCNLVDTARTPRSHASSDAQTYFLSEHRQA